VVALSALAAFLSLFQLKMNPATLVATKAPLAYRQIPLELKC